MKGIIPLGTSMDKECQRTIDLGCWDGYKDVSQPVEGFYSMEATPKFECPTDFSDFLIEVGFGKDVSSETREFWRAQHRKNYPGDDGRQRLYMCSVNLRDRDGLHARIADITCPVLWLHGTADLVYSVANAKYELPLFKRTDAQLEVVDGGQHFLSHSQYAQLRWL